MAASYAFGRGGLAAGILLAAQSGALAQEGETNGLPFDIDAKATVSSGYISNVFSTETNIQGDFVTIVEPEIGVSKKGENFELAVGAGMEIGRYFDLTSENYMDISLRGLGRFEVVDGVVLFAGGDYLWEHEPRTSPDDVGGIEPTEYTDASAYGGVSAEFDPFTFRIGVNYRRLDFDDVLAPGRVVNNDDRDREHLEVGVRAGYIFMPKVQAFVQVVHDSRDYDAAFDDAMVNRDSEGLQVAVGVAGETGNIKGEVLVGGLFYDYDNPAFRSVNTFDVGAEFTWRTSDRTRVTGTVSREIRETTVTGASSAVSTLAGARVNHWIAPDLSAFGYAYMSQEDYQNVARIDYLTELGFGLRHYLTPNVFVGAQYGFEYRNSDVAAADYTSHEFLLSLGADLDPAWKGDPALASFEAGGFYVGVQAAHGAVLTPVTGSRGNNGSLSAEFGGNGAAGGLFAGYRLMVDNFMLGLEAEGDIGETEWSHNGNRTFSIRRENSFGASALFGFETVNDVLLYARAGVASTEFEGSYARGGGSARVSDRETGLRFGAGAEFPIGNGLSGRMEYVYTNYGDLALGPPGGNTGNDLFANAEAVARFGLIYRFGAGPGSDPVPVDFSGFYGGIQVGHEVLTTDNSGARTRPTPAFVLDATRAGQGFTGGLFVGYGATFGDFYLGGEIDVDYATTNWNIERDPNGRIYSVEKRGSVGGSLRAGYVLNDAVLMYFRGGVVGTRFENEYSDRGPAVTPSKTLAGLRLGGGIEFAATEDTRLRLDYTHTIYPDYTVSYGTGTDRFDSSENLFRMGVVFDF